MFSIRNIFQLKMAARILALNQVINMRRVPRPYRFGNRTITSKAEVKSDADFKKNYRMSKATYDDLRNIVTPMFQTRTNSNALDVDEIMLTFLKYCGGNDSYLEPKVSICSWSISLTLAFLIKLKSGLF